MTDWQSLKWKPIKIFKKRAEHKTQNKTRRTGRRPKTAPTTGQIWPERAKVMTRPRPRPSRRHSPMSQSQSPSPSSDPFPVEGETTAMATHSTFMDIEAYSQPVASERLRGLWGDRGIVVDSKPDFWFLASFSLHSFFEKEKCFYPVPMEYRGLLESLQCICIYLDIFSDQPRYMETNYRFHETGRGRTERMQWPEWSTGYLIFEDVDNCALSRFLWKIAARKRDGDSECALAKRSDDQSNLQFIYEGIHLFN